MSEITIACEAKLQELKNEKKAIVATRDSEIDVAKAKYKDSLKTLGNSIIATKRILKTSERLDQGGETTATV